MTTIVAIVAVGLTVPPATLAGDGTFTSAADVGVGTNPISVAVADVNSDGHEDLVVANFNGGSSTSPTVSVRFGVGDGSFAPAADVGAGTGPYSVAVADFNADGHEDMAVANLDGDVTVRLGVGNGGFTNAADVGVGSSPRSVAVGDFNSDGDEDLAVADAGGLSVRLGAVDGTFTNAPQVGGTASPDSVAVGDFDSDGIQDLVVTNYAADTVGVRLGAGGGTFTAAADVEVGSKPRIVAVGDFNSDGDEDLAVANQDGGVSVRLGSVEGSFIPASDVSAGTMPGSVAVGDFNSDGNEDLVVANEGGNTVSLRLGAGDGTFLPAPDLEAGPNPRSVAIGDFNSDGNEDLAIANYGGASVSVRLGAGAAPLEGNLLQNGGFEGAGAGRLFTASPEIPGWSRTGGMTFARYGIPPNWSTPTHLDSPRYLTGGLNFVWGGNSAATGGITTAFQTVDVAGQAASIDAGIATANLSAYLGGGAIYNDRIKVTADFLDTGGAALGTFQIGPVTAAERRNVTTLLPRAGSAPVPVGTRRIRVTLTAIDPDSSYSGGLADNVKLTLDAPDPPDGGAGGPAAFGPDTLVILSLVSKRIRAKGPVPVRVSNGNAFKVTGSLAGRSTKAFAAQRRKRKRVKLAGKRFTVGANARATVKLKLPKRLRRVLKRKRKLGLRLTARVTDSAGNTRTVKKRSPRS